MTEELNPYTQNTQIEGLLQFARSLPDFPHKALVIQRLETANINRYQETMLTLNELLAGDDLKSQAEAAPGEITREQIQELLTRITGLESMETFDQG